MLIITLMPRTKVDDKGRISIPAEIRRELGLKPEDDIIVERDGSRVILKKPDPEIRTVNSRGGWRRKPFITAKEALGGP
jgi:AbrB family looped-hinge helix DNA binding protein